MWKTSMHKAKFRSFFFFLCYILASTWPKARRKPSHGVCLLNINYRSHCHPAHAYSGETSGSRKINGCRNGRRWGFLCDHRQAIWTTNNLLNINCWASTCGPSCTDLISLSIAWDHRLGGCRESLGGTWRSLHLARGSPWPSPTKNLISAHITRKNLINNPSYLQLYSPARQQRKPEWKR